MQRMRPHVPPEPIQTDLTRRGPRPRDLEDARRGAQAHVCGHDFSAGHPLGKLAAVLGRERLAARPVEDVRRVQAGGFGVRGVG